MKIYRNFLLIALIFSSWLMAANNPAIGGKLRHNAKLPTGGALESEFEYGLENCYDIGSEIECDYFIGEIDSRTGNVRNHLSIMPQLNQAEFGANGNALMALYTLDLIVLGNEVDAVYLSGNTSDVIIYNGIGTSMSILSDDGPNASSDLEFTIKDASNTIVSWNHMVSSPLSLAFNIEGSTVAEVTDTKLQVNGDIELTGIITTNHWRIQSPDYVFEPDYKLRSLNEVETYIKEHKHLPEIPSAKEFEEKGMDIATMNMRLLKKVEELTIYTISQEKRIKHLEQLLTKNRSVEGTNK